jgi:DNA polymerase-3 subunit alpha
MNNFVHLHVHSEYSLLDGLGKPDKIFEKVKELGQTSIAITDHGNMDVYVKAIHAAESSGIKYIPGSELYIVDNVEQFKSRKRGEKKLPRHHITLWAKNIEGVNAIFRLLNTANMHFAKGRPNIDWEILAKEKSLDYNVIAGSGCVGGIINSENFEKILDIFESIYLEVMPHIMAEQIETNKKVLVYSKRYGLPIVGVNDSHYIDKDHSYYQEVLLAIQSRTTWDDPKRWKFSIAGLYLKTRKEMLDSFIEQGVMDRKKVEEYLDNTLKIAESSNCIFKRIDVKLPKVISGNISSIDLLIEHSVNGLDRICKVRPNIKKNIDKYSDRMEEELSLIFKLGFQEYFLLVEDLINWAKSKDILVGSGRGSVGGSLIAFCLGITTIDPLEYNLLFARFISPARIDLPDIDMDFEDARRWEIREYLQNRYGEKKVAGVSTFLEMHGRGTLRDVSRVFKVPLADVGGASKAIVVRSGGDVRASFTIEDAFNTFEEGKAFIKKYPEVSKTAMVLEGSIKSVGIHAAGTVISINDFDDGIHGYLRKGGNGDIAINWDKEDLEYMGLMKLDILGLNALTILNSCKKLVKKNKRIDIDYYNMLFDDKRIFKEFDLGNTVGIFQFGSYGIRKLCTEVGIVKFNDLVDVNALFRPGTLRSGLATEYCKRKKGQSSINYINHAMEKLTGDTYGIILYQEQIMLLLYELGGMSWKTTDMVRKVVSKSKGEEQFMMFKTEFIEGCEIKKTLNKKDAEKVFDELKYFGSYGFNRSHSVEYSAIAYWMMFAKTYYPDEFFESLMTYSSSEDKFQAFIDEMKRMGFNIHPVDFNKSDITKWIILDKEVYPPIKIIKGIGEKAVEEIINWKKQFKRMTESIWIEGKGLNKRVINKRIKDVIIKSGALLEFGDGYDNIDYRLYPYSWETRKMIDVQYKLFDEALGLQSLGGKLSTEKRWYFAQITETKFGYHAKVKKQQVNQKEILGSSDSLGGVYGYARDMHGGYQMITFRGDTYMNKKYEIEHSAGKWALLKGSPITFSENIIIENVIIEDEIQDCNFGDLKLPLYKRIHSEENKNLKDCSKCSLIKECKNGPVPSEYRSNIAILGEGPGREEDKNRKNFFGKAGKKLWDIFNDYGLVRNDFSIFNSVKCWPSITKNPKDSHINACSEWLKFDLETIKPVIVLALGRVASEIALGETVKITEITGQCKWSNIFNCWVVSSIHPASVLYGSLSEEDLKISIDKFISKLEIFI